MKKMCVLYHNTHTLFICDSVAQQHLNARMNFNFYQTEKMGNRSAIFLIRLTHNTAYHLCHNCLTWDRRPRQTHNVIRQCVAMFIRPVNTGKQRHVLHCCVNFPSYYSMHYVLKIILWYISHDLHDACGCCVSVVESRCSTLPSEYGCPYNNMPRRDPAVYNSQGHPMYNFITLTAKCTAS